MIRLILGVIAGFLGWMILWFAAEQIISIVWPAFGVHQAAFQSAIENGGSFAADPAILAVHCVLAFAASAATGYLAALISGGDRRSVAILAILLLAIGLLKAAMSWALVPVWYHAAFTAILPVMALAGGRLVSRKNALEV